MHAFLLWVVAHPESFVLGVTTVVSTGLAVMKLFMSPERYARLAPRIAGVLKIFGGVFPDLVKASRGVKQVVSGKSDVEFRSPIVEEEEKK